MIYDSYEFFSDEEEQDNLLSSSTVDNNSTSSCSSNNNSDDESDEEALVKRHDLVNLVKEEMENKKKNRNLLTVRKYEEMTWEDYCKILQKNKSIFVMDSKQFLLFIFAKLKVFFDDIVKSFFNNEKQE
ncbi:hypothetical protein ABK040_014710 [Willaertia magna]